MLGIFLCVMFILAEHQHFWVASFRRVLWFEFNFVYEYVGKLFTKANQRRRIAIDLS